MRAATTFTLEPLSVNGGTDVYTAPAGKALVVQYVAGRVHNARGDAPSVSLRIVAPDPGGGTRTVQEWPMALDAQGVFQQQVTVYVAAGETVFMHVTRGSQSTAPTFYELSLSGELTDPA